MNETFPKPDDQSFPPACLIRLHLRSSSAPGVVGRWKAEWRPLIGRDTSRYCALIG